MGKQWLLHPTAVRHWAIVPQLPIKLLHAQSEGMLTDNSEDIAQELAEAAATPGAIAVISESRIARSVRGRSIVFNPSFEIVRRGGASKFTTR